MAFLINISVLCVLAGRLHVVLVLNGQLLSLRGCALGGWQSKRGGQWQTLETGEGERDEEGE